MKKILVCAISILCLPDVLQSVDRILGGVEHRQIHLFVVYHTSRPSRIVRNCTYPRQSRTKSRRAAD